MHRTAHHQTRKERGKAPAGSPGELQDSCMQVSQYSLLALLCISSAPETRVSKRQHCDLWAHHLSWRGSRVACYVLCSVYLPSLAADGGPTTRRAEDCPVAWKAKRCHWRGAQARELDQHNAHPRGASTHPLATCPASPAARRTSDCADTARPTRPRHIYSRKRCLCSRRDHSRSRHRHCNRQRRVRPREDQGQRVGASARPRGTCPSQARPTVNSSSAPRSYAPNQAINTRNTFYTNYH